jgi:hypothetical protein
VTAAELQFTTGMLVAAVTRGKPDERCSDQRATAQSEGDGDVDVDLWPGHTNPI